MENLPALKPATSCVAAGAAWGWGWAEAGEGWGLQEVRAAVMRRERCRERRREGREGIEDVSRPYRHMARPTKEKFIARKVARVSVGKQCGRSFDSASRDETARASAQDDGFK